MTFELLKVYAESKTTNSRCPYESKPNGHLTINLSCVAYKKCAHLFLVFVYKTQKT